MSKLDYCGPSSAETAERYPRDQELREAGFEVHARPAKGADLWRFRRPGNNDLIVTAREAESLARKWRKQKGT